MHLRILAPALYLLGLANCSRPAHATEPGRSDSSVPAPIVTPDTVTPSAPTSTLPALDAPRFVQLPVPGFGDAVVSVPVGTTRPRPIILAAHGNYDQPEWQCETWRGIVGNRAFVLCPRGTLRRDAAVGPYRRFTYRSQARLNAEITAGLVALRARFRDHADGGPIVYTGFSLGAIFGPGFIARSPEPVALAVLTEGSHAQWSDAKIRAFRAQGGQRVLFACGQGGCPYNSRRVGARFARVGVQTAVAYAPRAGHRYDGPVAREIRAQLDWLLADDPRFAR